MRRPVRKAAVNEIYEWRSDHIALEIGRRLAPQSGLVTQVERRWAEQAAGTATLQARSPAGWSA